MKIVFNLFERKEVNRQIVRTYIVLGFPSANTVYTFAPCSGATPWRARLPMFGRGGVWRAGGDIQRQLSIVYHMFFALGIHLCGRPCRNYFFGWEPQEISVELDRVADVCRFLAPDVVYTER